VLSDIGTVIWKEWKELIARSTQSRSDTIKTVAVVAVILGVVLWRASHIISNPGALIVPSFALTQLLAGIMADSFAGERERHTLETLLASRLSDLAILIGKIAAGVLLVWGLMLFTTGLVVVSSLISDDGGPASLSLGNIAAILSIYFLLCLAMSCAAAIVSLRAPTVRQAIQTLTWSFMIVFFLGIFAVARLPLEWGTTLTRVLMGENLLRTQIIVAGILAGLIVVLFGAARLRFQRARLILN
jgi:ABC-2 type transport system permease protein